MNTASRRSFLLGGGIAARLTGADVVKEARSSKPRQRTPQASFEQVRAFAAGHNALGFDLFQWLRAGSGNLFFSPYSIAQALTMASAGARVRTARQLAQGLHSAFPQSQLHAAANALDLGLGGRSSDPQNFRLESANTVWGQRDYAFRQEFLDVLAANYGAGLRLLDFAASRLLTNGIVDRAAGLLGRASTPSGSGRSRSMPPVKESSIQRKAATS
ncbi:MAG: hypothetical protein HY235_16405 [Acidobacteria bacterium]|nr:hypothetical protein [Acidobacteriota bacterium]